MMSHRQGLPPMPDRVARLPVDARGYPVPWFVAWIDGKPDFRVIRENGVALAHKMKRCWICGDHRGRNLAFVIGPMCAVNRVSSEPPSHRECAVFAAMACPFLTLPKAQRRDTNMPDHNPSAGFGLKRNPGVALVWVTRDYHPFRTPDGGVLFQVGDPTETLWFAEGREAKREEIEESIRTGLPSLQEMADAEGGDAPAALAQMHRAAMTLLPA